MGLVFTAHPGLFYAALILFGLAVGSFLNVVISRLPRMMEAEWRAGAAEILAQADAVADGVADHRSVEAPPDREPRFNLATPASHCPGCDAPIRAWQNIPVISFIALRGRCARCGTSISWQYPAVEIVAAVMAVAVGVHFGPVLFVVFALLLSWALLALAVIDWQTQLLPDAITLPLLWLGLLLSLGHSSAFSLIDPATAILGAAAGYGVLWLVFQLFLLVTGKQGMGYGDFKLLGAIGAWLGWQNLPLVLLMASVAGALVGGLLMATGQLQRGRPMPFGPWLAAAGWLALIAGDTITNAYLSLSGLR